MASLFEWLVEQLKLLVAWAWAWVRNTVVTLGEGIMAASLDALDYAGVPDSAIDQATVTLNQINHFVGLAEGLSYSAFLFTQYLAIQTYRVIKSWIPTVGV